MAQSSISDWLASMSSAQQWIVGALLLLVLGRLFQAIKAKEGVAEALFDVGGPAVLAAAAGGFRVLMVQAGVLQGVTSIPKGQVVAPGNHMGLGELTKFGDHLLVNAIYIYLVFLLVLAVLFLEVRWAAESRRATLNKPIDLVRRIGVGYLLTAFVGAFAIYLIYTAS